MIAREKNGLTREKASEKIDGISPSRLEKLENGRTTMQPEDVVMLARAYKEPKLCNYYCTHECALGRKKTPELAEKELPQIAIELVNAVSLLYREKDQILQIAEDGRVSREEYGDFSALKETISKLIVSAQTLDLWLETETAQGRIDANGLNPA